MRKSQFPRSLKKRNSLWFGLVLASMAGMVCQAQTLQDLGVKEQSAFDAPAAGRDPFLPVGWQKAPEESLPGAGGAPAAESLLKPESFLVSSISVDRIRLAVINGKFYGEGESFSYQVEGKREVTVQVVKIQDGMVTLRCGSMQVSCPLRISTQRGVKKP